MEKNVVKLGLGMSAENEAMKAPKYYPREPKTRAPKIQKGQKIEGLFQALY